MAPPKTEELIEEIKQFLRRIGASEAILFGSRARGDALETSDVDLIVISEKFKGVPFPRRLVMLQEQWRSPLFLQAIPYTPEEFRRLSGESSLLKRALSEGIRIVEGD